MENTNEKLNLSILKRFIPQIIENMPLEWLGTTFKNDANYVGREKFIEGLTDLIIKKDQEKSSITISELESVGNAEDYIRVASNPATLLEMFYGIKYNYKITETFSFSSNTMPILSVLFITDKNVHIYSDKIPFTDEEQKYISKLNMKIKYHLGDANPHSNDLVISLSKPSRLLVYIDCFIYDNILFINSNKINHNDILMIRKRMATPETTPKSINRLKKIKSICGNNCINEIADHLRKITGCTSTNEISFATVGLASLMSLFVTMIIFFDGADVVMSSTSYGGSNKLVSILADRYDTFHKYHYDIQGDRNITKSICNIIDNLMIKSGLRPITMIMIEIPTNPEMKIPTMETLIKKIREFKKVTNKKILLIIDTTLAPTSAILGKLEGLETIIFISLSKSVSGGKTTGGCLIANHTELAMDIVRKSSTIVKLFDVGIKDDQIMIIGNQHKEVEKRIDMAYLSALNAKGILERVIFEETGWENFKVCFVNQVQAADGFKPSTFSFNLPPMGNDLASKFVSYICKSKICKPCVSFGQNNDLVYVTIPEISTQGDIKKEDKDKQSVGGIQLVRLSFPPKLDLDEFHLVIQNAVKMIYS
jgi:cystathionine beta-lyase/cystathionine gamma-synthase